MILHAQTVASPQKLYPVCAIICLSGKPIGEHPLTTAATPHFLPIRIVLIKNSSAALTEQPLLTCHIFCKIGMLPCSDMVFPQIGKHCRIKHNSIYPVHFQRLRRNFHDNVLAALIHHFSQYFIQFIRFRCSVTDCLLPYTITNLYRSDQTTLLTIRRKHFPDHPCGRCLSFRPGHTNNFQFFLRIVKPLTGDRCQRSPRVRSFQYTIFLLLSSLL